MRSTSNRPKYLNLLQIRLPLPGVISIMHRVSGAVLFLALPLLLYWLQQSLASSQSFAGVKTTLAHPFIKLVILGLAWGYLHHFCAGIRHVAMDMHYGTELATARMTSWLVLGISIALTLVAGALLW